VTRLRADADATAPRFLAASVCDEANRSTKKQQPHPVSDLGPLRQSSAILFSWTHLNRERKVLLQINGERPRNKWRRYRAVVQNL
jgi:hypothetical protein